MRLTSTALLTIAFLTSLAIGQESRAAENAQPSDQEVVGLAGARLARVFAKFGAPADMSVSDAASNEPSVCLDYGAFGFLVRNKIVVTVLFWQDWTGSACGVAIGDTADAIVKKFGKPDNLQTEDDGRQRLYWDYKANDEVMRLQVTCGQDKKCTRVIVSVK